MAADRLTDREQQALRGIESALDRDRALHRRLGLLGMRFRLPQRSAGVRVLALCGLASLGLLVLGVVTASPAAIWAFAVCWPLTVVIGFLAVRRHMGAGGSRPPRPFV
ncbi:DUF3040 domain-containing protein [Streptomyces sp. SID4919]|uniref:DUF3040 domain-containing protein n=1 Tax=unclassified Streptomyces TaxID=2593676 RepID=UPI000823D7B5|nr:MULTISPECIES: DUF3040 domain-containing protein [unclassified Streptomyces]MYY13918.1 DUF3040 domain-containing protein [Streptomyces sp. SID4919]SCK31440.1 Protein of unknown function [Streptomyces sp. AmelKG-E11A]